MKSALLSFLTEIPNALRIAAGRLIRIAAGQGADVRTVVRLQVPQDLREQPAPREPQGLQERQEPQAHRERLELPARQEERPELQVRRVPQDLQE